MADYASNKVPELKKLLVERGLSDKGNKAELVARLKENDEAGAGGEKVDEITWTDDAPAADAAPAAAPAVAAEKPAEPVPTPAVASSAAPTDGAVPEGTVAEAATEAAAEGVQHAEAPAAPAVSYAAGLNATTADEEAKRRAERAKRFGIEPEEETEEAKLKRERAKRFGIDEDGDSAIVGGLDSALPERRERKAGSARIEKRRGGRDGGRRGGRGGNDRRGGRGGNERRQGGGGVREGQGQGKKSGSGIFSDPAEKAKAEARAARFAAN